MGNSHRPQAILAWRPVLLFGGGLALAIFEAVQPLFGRQVEWAIVSLAATMMGLEVFSRSQEPPPDPGSRGGQGGPAGPAGPANREDPERPGGKAALAVPAAVVAAAAAVARAGLVTGRCAVSSC